MRDDVILNDNNDIIDDGTEWTEGESSEDDVELIFLSNKGDSREFPFAGFGAQRKLKERTDKISFVRELNVELENDGFINPVIDLSNGFENLKIEVQ